MPILVKSFIPNNTLLTNAVVVEWLSANIWVIWKEIEVISVQNIDRDYSLKEIPTILNTDVNRNKDLKDVIRLVEFWKDRKINNTVWTNENDYIRTDAMIADDVVNMNFEKISNIWLNSDDILEIFVNFSNKPKQFNIEIKDSFDSQNIFWWENFMFTDIVDGINIIKAWKLDDIETDKWYKIYLPIKWTVLENDNLWEINFSAFNWDFKISEISILKDKLRNSWNNIRITFDVDILEDTQKRDIIFWLTNNATLLENQWYEVIFSKNGASTELLKNGIVIWSVTNDDSYIKEWVDKYRLMFVKNKDHLYVSVKYDYLDPEDWILKVKVDHLLDIIDTQPLNLKNSQLVFKNNKNKYKVSNIRIEDWEDNERLSFVKFKAINQNYWSGKITVYNNKWDVDSVNFQLYDNLEDLYVSLTNLTSYNSIITDVIIQPNELTTSYNTYNITEVALIKESETPALISWNTTMDLLGTAIIKKGSDVVQLFKNSKEYIMWYTLFLSKVSPWVQPEWLTLRMYEADWNGDPKVDWTWEKIVLAEKNINTDWVAANPSITPLKIIFPQIAVVDWKDYLFELSTNNPEGLYIYWTDENTFAEWYAYTNREEYPFVAWYEFNEFWKRTYGAKWSIWYLGSILGWVDVPTREIITRDNLLISWKASNNSTVTFEHARNQNLYYKGTFILKWNFTSSNGTWSPMIIKKEQTIDGELFRNYKFSIFGTKLAWSFWFIGTTNTMDFISSVNFADQDVTIAISIDTYNWVIKLYKNGVFAETIAIDPEFVGIPLDSNEWQINIMWNHSTWTNDMEIDFIRMYDSVLELPEIIEGSLPITKYKYKLPYDLAFFMISKSNEVETVEERTYDLGDWIIYEVAWDLILDWYDDWDGITRLILKWNSTFRVKWDIIINANGVLVINDNTKEWDEALSYIWFVTDNDIIIWKDVQYMQGWYFSNNAIKTELSNVQLKVSWLLSGYEVDLQNRTYLQQGKVCSADEKDNCSVILEFDKRIYKRMPPLFYENDDKGWIQIVEE